MPQKRDRISCGLLLRIRDVCYQVVSADRRNLRFFRNAIEQLKAFRDNNTAYACQSIDELAKQHFTDTIRELAAILSDLVTHLVDTKSYLQAANALIVTLRL
jgi:hypothetical protein